MALVELLGENLVKKAGGADETVPTSGLTAAYVGLYFSGSWCGPCRSFTPILKELYKKDGVDLEVVYVSCDFGEAPFNAYLSDMPWLAIPFSDQEKRAEVTQKYQVRGIPTLVIVNAQTGETVTEEGVSSLQSDPSGTNFPWA